MAGARSAGRRRAATPDDLATGRHPDRRVHVRGWAWLVLLAVVVVVLASELFGIGPLRGLPDQAVGAASVLMTTFLAVGLAVRTGGRPLFAGLVTLVVGGTIIAVAWPVGIAGLAVATGVLAAVLAVLGTVPATTFQRAAGEAIVALVGSGAGTLALAGYAGFADLRLDLRRLEYIVLAGAAILVFALVFRLGAGLHGIGRRGYAIAGGAVVVVGVALAYGEAMSAWGSETLLAPLDAFRMWVRDTFGGVPHPIVALLGIPAIVMGTFMRARRRQGWWVCAFGVAATAPSTTRLLDPEVPFTAVALGGVYSLLVGLLLGYVAIRVEQFLTGSRGRRARRAEEAIAHRSEPGRFEPLQ